MRSSQMCVCCYLRTLSIPSNVYVLSARTFDGELICLFRSEWESGWKAKQSEAHTDWGPLKKVHPGAVLNFLFSFLRTQIQFPFFHITTRGENTFFVSIFEVVLIPHFFSLCLWETKILKAYIYILNRYTEWSKMICISHFSHLFS